ncbi:DUF1804 family protein [Accumulibacter sp.]|uniref:DUF1804 family protein n=1 Tax=Accumulibacter sp. TaxID=2053492 RepID=UPI0026336E9E|nr:DUF1804 family protein [Accumulibacter sp.]
MAHSPELRMQLRAAYIGGLPLEQAAEKVGVPAGTARNWYRAARDAADDWDKFRAASLIVAGGGIEQALGRIIAAGLMRCEALLEKTADAADPFEGVKAMATLGDTIAKLRAAAKSFMPEISAAAVAADTLKALAHWTGDTAPARGIVLADLLEPFAAARQLPIAAQLEELRARARAAGAVDTTRSGGLSDDSAEQIRMRLLGVK